VTWDAEETLWEDLLWASEKKEWFEINLNKIQDNLSFAKRGASWVTNQANGLKDKRLWMMGRMLRAPTGQQLREKRSMKGRRRC
jgi:hypothetical protein